jgi:hypothetical protein
MQAAFADAAFADSKNFVTIPPLENSDLPVKNG